MANSPDSGSEPINFRAALATFEQQSATSSPHPTRLPTNSPSRHNAPPPHTPHRSASDPRDPVPRSSSTPRVRKNSDGLLPPSFNNPFSSPKLPSLAIPTTSASGMLSAPSSAFRASPSPQLTPVKKSDSGLSLNQLINKSLPRSSASSAPSAMSRSRSKSITTGAGSNGNSAPRSGRSTPSSRSLHGLFTPEDGNAPLNRTSSPSMLDQGAEEDQGPMFGHAVMQPGPPSPERKSASLPPPHLNQSKNGSTSSTNSASTPKLPPRPGSLAPSPTISEFGQFPNPSSTPTAKSGNVGYATYTPGVKRHLGSASGGAGGGDGTNAPPALPPRSATLGQSAERGRLDAPTYRARQRSPLKPVVPKKPAKPVPPPRPGAAGGFRFGSGTYSNSSSEAVQPAPPPPRQRTLAAKTPQRNMSSAGSAGASGLHRKTGSSVFTSISLSDDASGELKRSLESDLHSDHAALPPPSRGRPMPGTPSSLRPTPSTSSASSSAVGAGVGVVSSLIGSAASALPLFKSSAASNSSRGLAEGAPSKQGYVGGTSMRRSTSAHSMGEMGEAVWSSGRAVQLAEPAKETVRLREPRDERARERYEELFESMLAKQTQRRERRRRKVEEEGMGSNASTIRGGEGGEGERRASAGGVQTLRGWFESDSSLPEAVSSNKSTNPSSIQSPSSVPAKPSDRLSAKTVRSIWTRSKLVRSFLGQVWDQAVSLQAADEASKGLGKEAFVRAMASIDAELERKQKKKQARAERRKKKEAAARRVPPPPPPHAN